MIETERLLIRPLTAGDADFIVALLNDPDFLRHIGDRAVRDTEGALAYIATATLSAVVERASGRPVGLCGLVRRDWLGSPDLGYAFLPDARGLGYAREAVRAVLAGTEGLVLAIVSPGNHRSIALLEEFGFAFVRLVHPPQGGQLRLYERGGIVPSG